MLKTIFSEVYTGSEFMLGSEDFRKEDETKAKNITDGGDGLFRFFDWDTEVYVNRKCDLKVWR